MAEDHDIEAVYQRLFAWCEARDFGGIDPFDALNSRIFQTTPFSSYRLPRLAFTQLIKRSPINLRPLLAVPPGVNAKAIALFALAEISRYRATDSDFHESNAQVLLDRLLELGISEGKTLAFGYNFDWQSRVFFAPKSTPTIVPTAFASQAFFEGFEAFGGDQYRNAVERIAEFAAAKLNRSVETEDEVCFSYTPLDESRIYNASLLAAECLVRAGNPSRDRLVEKAVNFVVRRQQNNGSWAYGEGHGQGWIDSFHTAYVLTSLDRISKTIGIDGTAEIENGKRYWLDNFFLADGTPRYYDSNTEPVDIHSAAAAIATAAELGELDLAERVARWTMKNMRDVDGFFYYRVGRFIVNQTAFMRWGQAWMAYALAKLIEAR